VQQEKNRCFICLNGINNGLGGAGLGSFVWWSLGIFLSFLIIFATDSEATDKRVSLKEAVTYALENNYELKALRYELSAISLDVEIAKGSLYPKLTFEGRFLRTNNPTYSFMAKLNQARFNEQDFAVNSLNNPKAVNDFQSTVSFEQPLFVKKAHVGIELSKKELEAKEAEFQHKRQEIALRVAKAFIAVKTAKESVTISQRAVEEAQEHLRIARIRYENKMGLLSDTLRAETALKEAEQNAVSAQKGLNVALRALNLILGSEGNIEPDEGEVLFTVKDLAQYESSAQNRIDLTAMSLRVDNAKNNIALVEADYYPIVGLGGSYQINDHRRPFGAEGDSWQVMAFLRWNIYDGNRRSHERSKAQHQLSQITEQLKEMKRFVAFRVYEAYQNYEEALKNVEIAKKAYESALEGMRLVKVRYENSLSPIVDLLSAQVALDRARVNLVSKKDELAMAIINLSYEGGSIFKDLGIE
jgi:outer membrane protein